MQKNCKTQSTRKTTHQHHDMKRTKARSFFSAELELFGHPRSEGWSKGEKETCIQVQRTHDISWEDIRKRGYGRAGKFQTWRRKKRETHLPTSWTKYCGRKHTSFAWDMRKMTTWQDHKNNKQWRCSRFVKPNTELVKTKNFGGWKRKLSLHSGTHIFRFRK